MTTDRLAALLDGALRPYLALLRSPEDQNDKIIRGVAARLAANGVTVAPQPFTRAFTQERLARALHEARFYCWTNRDDVCTADHAEGARQLLAALAQPAEFSGSLATVHHPTGRVPSENPATGPAPAGTRTVSTHPARPAPDALPFAESQRFYNEGYAAGRRAADEDHRDRDKMCPDCGHPHLPMLEPWEMLGTRVDPMCNWPVGPDACECRRRTVASQPAPDALRAAAQAALNELGVPDDTYPAPVANAVATLRAALGDER